MMTPWKRTPWPKRTRFLGGIYNLFHLYDSLPARAWNKGLRNTRLTDHSTRGFPADARALHFQVTPLAYESKGRFSAPVGPRKRDPGLSRWGALQELLTPKLLSCFRQRAREYMGSKNLNYDYSTDAFWRYWIAVMQRGLVQYADEKDAYVGSSESHLRLPCE